MHSDKEMRYKYATKDIQTVKEKELPSPTLLAHKPKTWREAQQGRSGSADQGNNVHSIECD